MIAREDPPIDASSTDVDNTDDGVEAAPPAPPPPKQRRKRSAAATTAAGKKGELADADLIALGKLTLNANRANMTPEAYIKALQDIAEDLRILKLDAIAATVSAEIEALGRAAKLMKTDVGAEHAQA